MHDSQLSPKERKKEKIKRMRFQQEMFNFIRLRRDDDKRLKEREEALKPKKEERRADREVKDKVALIRNRLTDQKRESRERWNRFAGTSDGGGRGL